ncbi:hypothetical protein AB0F30_31170 [Streptomyces sp. NPDC029006]|uniref:hypothetical protein n=1 Tax=Streptomyces sp. NPDC029006 TaxID=3155467 RepID=UPI0033F216DE
MRTTLEGRSIAALAREHGVSRGAIRTVVADLLPDHTATDEDAPAPESPVTLESNRLALVTAASPCVHRVRVVAVAFLFAADALEDFFFPPAAADEAAPAVDGSGSSHPDGAF